MFKLFLKKAFSLIEVLFIIIIIGILASVIILILKEPIKKAKDSRIINAIGQIKNFAEFIHSEEDGYTNLCPSGNINTSHTKYSSELTTINTEITSNGGIPACYAFNNEYCVYSSLNLSGFFCADSAGKVVATATDPSGSCDGTTFTCP